MSARTPPEPTHSAEDVAAEVLRLRQAFAYEARITEAHYEGIKTFPKSRRRFAEEQVERMRMVARGLWPFHYDNDARILGIEYREALRGRHSDGSDKAAAILQQPDRDGV